MSESFDFDKYWIEKLTKRISEEVGDKIANEVIEGSENISQKSHRDDVFDWSDKAIRKLESLTNDKNIKKYCSAVLVTNLQKHCNHIEICM